VVGRYSHPAWWIEKVKAQHPEHYETLLSHGNTRPPLTLRINSRRSTPKCYVARLREARIDARSIGGMAVVLERPMPTALLPGFAEGLVSVQDASAQEAAAYLDMRAGQRVLDACAAPGGKAAHMRRSAPKSISLRSTMILGVSREWRRTSLGSNCNARVQRGDAAQLRSGGMVSNTTDRCRRAVFGLRACRRHPTSSG
jgi:16S rRNA (cytosine967-C5)-methyltransferase